MGAPFEIRPATPADLAAIVAIERRTFTQPWSAASLRDLLGDVALVAERHGALIGYVFGRAAADDAEIVNLAVRPDLHRQGIGRQLTLHCLDCLRDRGARRVSLEVREGNHAARALYRSLGFEDVGRRAGYYQQPFEDAVIMARIEGAGGAA